MIFVDLTKAFDTVSRETLWKIVAKFGCPAKFIAMVRQFYDGMLAKVQNDGEFSDPFPATNGVKQGCVLASTLFSMVFSAVLTYAFQDGDTGIPIRYRFVGKLFNLRRLQAKSKVQTEMPDELLFANDIAKGAPTEEKMKKSVDQVSDSCQSYDLTISIKKIEVVYQPAPGKPYKEPTITVKGQRLQVVDKSTYLGSTLSRVCAHWWWSQCQDCQTSAAFGRLHRSILDRSGIRLDTKLKLYISVVGPTQVYACETWTVYQRHAKRLNHFHTSCFRKLLKIKWQDRIPDTEVLKKTRMQNLHTLLKLAQLRWTALLPECLMNVCQRKSSIENYKWENSPMVVRTRTTWKPRLKTSTYHQSHGNRLHRIEQSGEAHKKGCWWIQKQNNQWSRAETCAAESQS